MNAIDTNVLFYSLDADEVVKQPQAVALLGQLTATPARLCRGRSPANSWGSFERGSIKAESAGKATLYGGQLVTGWRHDGDQFWCANLPGVKEGTWDFLGSVR